MGVGPSSVVKRRVVTSSLPGIYRLTYADWLRFPDDGESQDDYFTAERDSLRESQPECSIHRHSLMARGANRNKLALTRA